jgi:hypothetical protein
MAMTHKDLTRRLADLIVEALEVGSGKQERGVIAEIFRSFGLNYDELTASYTGIKRGREKDLRQKAARLLAEAAPTPESLLNEVVRRGGRFIAMVEEVYRRLASHTAAEAGTSDQFRLQRAGVDEEQLPISEAFIERIRHLDRVLRTIDIGSINEAALRSFVGWDNGSYSSWPLDSREPDRLALVNAILNLDSVDSLHHLPEAVNLARASADRMVAAAEKVVRAYIAHADLLSGIDAPAAVEMLFHREEPDDTDRYKLVAWTARSAVAELELFRAERVLAMTVGSDSVSGIGITSAIGLNARLETVVVPGADYRDNTGISKLALFVTMYRTGSVFTRTRPAIALEPTDAATTRTWFERVTTACDQAASWLADDVLTVTGSVEATEMLEALEEFLNLPLWRQRSLLYEVWALCATLDTSEQAGWTAKLRGLTETAGVWVLPVGAASEPVATLLHASDQGISLDVWREPARATATAAFTPDITISTPAPFTRDLLIVEAKDRIKMQAGHDRARDRTDQAPSERTALGVAQRYATALTPVATWVCNHCEFRQPADSAINHGNVWSHVYIADQFRPGNIPAAFTSSVRAALSPPGPRPGDDDSPDEQITGSVLVIDVTSSMHRKLDRAYARLAEPDAFAALHEFRAVLYSDHGPKEPYLVIKIGPFSTIRALLDHVRALPTGNGGDVDEALEDAMLRCHELTDDIGPQCIMVLTDAPPHPPGNCPYGISFDHEVQVLLQSGSQLYVADDWLSPDDQTWARFSDLPGFLKAPLSAIVTALSHRGRHKVI